MSNKRLNKGIALLIIAAMTGMALGISIAVLLS